MAVKYRGVGELVRLAEAQEERGKWKLFEQPTVTFTTLLSEII